MTELITAVKAKDKAKVETLLEGGSDPNENGAGGKDQVSNADYYSSTLTRAAQ